MASVRDVTSEAEYKAALSSFQTGALVTIFFHTPWAPPCKQMRTFFDALASQYPASDKIAFLAIDAEALPEISESFDVAAVPYFVLTRDGKNLESVSGSNSSKVRDAVEREAKLNSSGLTKTSVLPEMLSATPRATSTMTTMHLQDSHDLAKDSGEREATASGLQLDSGDGGRQSDTEIALEDLNIRLAGLVKAAPVMLFMKGTPSSPQCGFSRQIVQILRDRGVRYGFFNILADEEVRQGMKTFADWPTFPQLWVGGELVGGLDIVREEIETDPDFFAQYSVGRGNDDVATPNQQKTPQATAA